MKKAITLFLLTFMFCGIIQAQEKSTLNVKDLNSNIEKYIKKNHEGYKISEAYKYALVYVITVKKADVSESLVFNGDDKFLYKKTDADKSKFAMQTRATVSTDDVDSDIKKYVKKNYEGSAITEAYKYDEVYTTKIMKGTESETLVFDKDGKFIMKAPASTPAASVQQKDSIPTKPEMKTDSMKTDSIK